MGISTPSDELYTINTNQSGPPMSATQKIQTRLPRPNQNQNTFPKKQTKQKRTRSFYFAGHIFKLLSQEAKDDILKYNVEAFQKFKLLES